MMSGSGPARTVATAIACGVLLVVAAACNSTPTTPEGVVQRWYEGMFSNPDETASLTCERLRSSVGQMASYAGDSWDIDYDVTYEVVSQDADRAVVRFSGRVQMANGSDARTTDVNNTVTVVREDGAWKACS